LYRLIQDKYMYIQYVHSTVIKFYFLYLTLESTNTCNEHQGIDVLTTLLAQVRWAFNNNSNNSNDYDDDNDNDNKKNNSILIYWNSTVTARGPIARIKEEDKRNKTHR
jgi:hypothetical protein